MICLRDGQRNTAIAPQQSEIQLQAHQKQKKQKNDAHLRQHVQMRPDRTWQKVRRESRKQSAEQRRA